MAKEDFFSRKLKDLDAFKRLPKELSKGSLFGVALSLVTVVLISLLMLNEVILFLGFEVESGVKIDHKRDSGEVEVHIDIEFENHPCHFLGLDYVDYVGSHNKNVRENLVYEEIDLDPKLRKANAKKPKIFNRNDFKNDDDLLKDFKEKNQLTHTCRIRGYFNVLLVPGNFHIGFHSSGHLLRKFVQTQGGSPPVDFRHKINHLYFGKMKQHKRYHQFQNEFRLKRVNTLENFSSKTMAPTKGPFSFKYKLMIVPTDLIYENRRKEEMFQYRSFWNVAYYEQNYNYLLSFDYDLSSVTMTEKRVKKSFNEFLIHICGIVGGMVAFASFVHMILQKSVLKLLHKHSLGKYD